MKSNLSWVFGVLILIFISILTIFFSYNAIDQLLQPYRPVIPNPPSECIDECTNICPQRPEMICGDDKTSNYYNDSVFIVTKDQPYNALVATASMTGVEDDYRQTSRASFFNGERWGREVIRDQKSDGTIQTNNLIKMWNIEDDEDLIMKKNYSGSYDVSGSSITVVTEGILNEMPIRVDPGYTKFLSTTEGIADINGKKRDVYVMYSRIYSDDSGQVIVYDQDFRFNTDWLAFWSEDGEFYHIDKTNVKGYVPNYDSHSLGYKVDRIGRVIRTYEIDVVSDNLENPVWGRYNLGWPINDTISANHWSSFNKYPTLDYPWIMGLTEGEITKANGSTTKGVGIYEYIIND